MTRPFVAVDLFAGAGGTSTGLARAAEVSGRKIELFALNHWNVAVETHAANHPWAHHLCADIGGVDPLQVVKGGRLDLLVASPECTHHSNARGGKPMEDQSRASAWRVIEWASALRPETVLVENVREFVTWGPLNRDGRPSVRDRGRTFDAWVGALRSLGYVVEWRVLNAADYSDPTTRSRLFVMARRGRRAARWPAPSHAKAGSTGTFAGGAAPWRSAREAVIDWKLRGRSIFDRERPLADATLRRIAEGLRRFGGANAGPYLTLLRGTGTVRSVDEPIPSLTAGGEHVALVEPFLLSQQSGGAPRSTGEPTPTVATKGAIGLVQPFLVPFHAERRGQQPRTHGVDEPVPTLAASPTLGLCEPFVLAPLGIGRGNAPRSVEQPVPTVLASPGGGHLVEPIIVDYYGQGTSHPVSVPLSTCRTKQSHGLVEPVAGRQLDILFRMLQPHELARAMSFPEGYVFKGNRTEVVRQIGNAVAVGVAQALCGAALEPAA